MVVPSTDDCDVTMDGSERKPRDVKRDASSTPRTDPHHQGEQSPAAYGLTRQALRGIRWTYTSTIASVGLALLVTAILARLVAPAAFGVVAMAGVFLGLGSYFSQMGIGPALVQKPEIGRLDIIAAFGLSLLCGVALFAAMWIIAPLGVYILKSSQVVPVVRIMSVSLLLGALSNTSTGLLKREMRFRALAVAETLSYAGGYGVIGVLLAFKGFGVWSLVAAAVAQSALALMLQYAATRHPVGLTLRWKAYQRLLSYGSRFSLDTFVQFLGYSVEPIVISRALGSAALGFFSNAQKITNYATERLTRGLTTVLFPSFSSVQHDRARLGRAFLSSYFAIGILAVPLSVATVVSARELVLVILGPRWLPAVVVVRVLAVAAPFSYLANLSGVLCDALAKLNEKLAVDTTYVLLAIILVVGLLRWGLVGVVVAYAVAEVAYLLLYLVVVRKSVSLQVGELNARHFAIASSGVVVLALVWVSRAAAVRMDLTVLSVLLVEALAGIGGFVCVTLVRPAAVLREEMGMLCGRVLVDDTPRLLAGLLGWYARKYPVDQSSGHSSAESAG